MPNAFHLSRSRRRRTSPSRGVEQRTRALGPLPGSDADADRAALPHERDERTDAPPPTNGVIDQAATDLENGQVDTDRRGDARAALLRAKPGGG